MLAELIGLRLQASFPVVDLALATVDFRETIFSASLVGDHLIDVAIQLCLALIQFAVPRFDRTFRGLAAVRAARPRRRDLRPAKPGGPGCRLLGLFDFRELSLDTEFAFGERFFADFRQLFGAGFGDGLAFGDFLLARGDGFGALVEFLLALGQPLAGTLPFGFRSASWTDNSLWRRSSADCSPCSRSAS